MAPVSGACVMGIVQCSCLFVTVIELNTGKYRESNDTASVNSAVRTGCVMCYRRRHLRLSLLYANQPQDFVGKAPTPRCRAPGDLSRDCDVIDRCDDDDQYGGV